MVKIEFFNGGKSLGKFDNLKEMSNQEDRDLLARWNGITEYDEFILDGGRVHCRQAKFNGSVWMDKSGKVWETINNIYEGTDLHSGQR